MEKEVQADSEEAKKFFKSLSTKSQLASSGSASDTTHLERKCAEEASSGERPQSG